VLINFLVAFKKDSDEVKMENQDDQEAQLNAFVEFLKNNDFTIWLTGLNDNELLTYLWELTEGSNEIFELHYQPERSLDIPPDFFVEMPQTLPAYFAIFERLRELSVPWENFRNALDRNFAVFLDFYTKFVLEPDLDKREQIFSKLAQQYGTSQLLYSIIYWIPEVYGKNVTSLTSIEQLLQHPFVRSRNLDYSSLGNLLFYKYSNDLWDDPDKKDVFYHLTNTLQKEFLTRGFEPESDALGNKMLAAAVYSDNFDALEAMFKARFKTNVLNLFVFVSNKSMFDFLVSMFQRPPKNFTRDDVKKQIKKKNKKGRSSIVMALGNVEEEEEFPKLIESFLTYDTPMNAEDVAYTVIHYLPHISLQYLNYFFPIDKDQTDFFYRQNQQGQDQNNQVQNQDIFNGYKSVMKKTDFSALVKPESNSTQLWNLITTELTNPEALPDDLRLDLKTLLFYTIVFGGFNLDVEKTIDDVELRAWFYDALRRRTQYQTWLMKKELPAVVMSVPLALPAELPKLFKRIIYFLRELQVVCEKTSDKIYNNTELVALYNVVTGNKDENRVLELLKMEHDALCQLIEEDIKALIPSSSASKPDVISFDKSKSSSDTLVEMIERGVAAKDIESFIKQFNVNPNEPSVKVLASGKSSVRYPLHVAFQMRRFDVIQSLLRLGANILLVEGRKGTILFNAVAEGFDLEDLQNILESSRLPFHKEMLQRIAFESDLGKIVFILSQAENFHENVVDKLRYFLKTYPSFDTTKSIFKGRSLQDLINNDFVPNDIKSQLKKLLNN
jgi:hypothetical protein